MQATLLISLDAEKKNCSGIKGYGRGISHVHTYNDYIGIRRQKFFFVAVRGKGAIPALISNPLPR